ncbi:helix-turn-helix domain-containing protein [Collinsella sp. AGMB00827]|uniref:Helix-turn-helix domain-containing protein n=1 Tax=Collinsella ureilytica TaxID=2869515 RepID=A0ABS7MJ51_9ACTN|nr:helix-turn-helix transcriptional regulator [Collinsella urealyticum]MBY4797400.1 helix-turn-helix domain-containing protein [Collinsella urealyticum]
MRNQLRQKLGENIRARRLDARLTKVDFCLMAGISRPLLDLIEAGEANVTLDTLERLASAFDTDGADLLQ